MHNKMALEALAERGRADWREEFRRLVGDRRLSRPLLVFLPAWWRDPHAAFAYFNIVAIGPGLPYAPTYVRDYVLAHELGHIDRRHTAGQVVFWLSVLGVFLVSPFLSPLQVAQLISLQILIGSGWILFGEARREIEADDVAANYRTSQQIREAADRLLPIMVRDVDGLEEERKGTISVFEGPSPDVALSADANAENRRVADFIQGATAAGIAAAEIGVFVRSRRELPRARAAVEAAGLQAVELSERQVEIGERVSIGTMHLAKGLEFKAVAVMACDDEVLPLAERIDSVVEESDLDEVYETERHLLYVACTRARDRLLVSGVSPGSEFLADFG